MAIDTRSVARRRLKFGSLDDLLREAERLAAAERDGRLVVMGNWTLGQMFGHLAAWAGYPYDGYPPSFTAPPWILRVILKRMKNKFLRHDLPVGFRMRGVKEGTFGTEALATAEGLRRLEASAARLKQSPPMLVNPVFGPMTHEEWIAIMLRHGELHCGFFDVQ